MSSQLSPIFASNNRGTLKSINEDMNSIINQQFKIDFNVPLLLEAKIGDNWLDTKDVS